MDYVPKTKIRRVNLWGGPGVSKSTNAAMLFGALKSLYVPATKPITVELVQEYVKGWAYEGRTPNGWKQVYTFSKQLQKECVPLTHGVDVIVSDSPLMLSCLYAQMYGTPGHEELIGIAQKFEHHFPSLNILLQRGERPYVQTGRFQDLEQAKEIDRKIQTHLIDHGIPYVTFPYNDSNSIREYVTQNIEMDVVLDA